MKIIYIDLETGGLDPTKSPIVQLAALIEINGVLKEQINWLIKPDDDQEISPEAYEVHGWDKESLKDAMSQKEAFLKFRKILEKYVNKYDKKDKFYMVGYNCHTFDAQFLRYWFLRHEDNYYGSYFFHPSIDVMLALAVLSMGQRHNLDNFQLMTVAKSLGLIIEESKAHDALYDVEVTKRLFDLVREELEI